MVQELGCGSSEFRKCANDLHLAVIAAGNPSPVLLSDAVAPHLCYARRTSDAAHPVPRYLVVILFLIAAFELARHRLCPDLFIVPCPPLPVRYWVASGVLPLLRPSRNVKYLIAAVVSLELVPRASFWTAWGILTSAAVLRMLLPESELFLKARTQEIAAVCG